MAFDIGRVEAWRAGAPVRVAPLAELELELIDGDARDLFALAREIVSQGGGRLRPSFRSKAAQARALSEDNARIGSEAPIRLRPEDSAADALAAALAGAAARIVEVAPAIVDLRLPEGVHQMRVALRRFRSLERTFRKDLKTKAIRKLARRARGFASALGPARDWDVFLEETLPPLAASNGGGAEFAALKLRAEALRAAAWEEAVRTIASADFARFSLDLIEAAHVQAWRERARKRLAAPARAYACAALDARLAEAREAARRIDSPDPAARHPLRIALKKLRYSAQTFRALYPKAARKAYLGALSRLQDDLGAVNDAVTAQRLANEAALGQGRQAARDAGFIAGYYAAAGEAKARAVGEDWRVFAATPPFWREAKETS